MANHGPIQWSFVVVGNVVGVLTTQKRQKVWQTVFSVVLRFSRIMSILSTVACKLKGSKEYLDTMILFFNYWFSTFCWIVLLNYVFKYYSSITIEYRCTECICIKIYLYNETSTLLFTVCENTLLMCYNPKIILKTKSYKTGYFFYQNKVRMHRRLCFGFLLLLVIIFKAVFKCFCD